MLDILTMDFYSLVIELTLAEQLLQGEVAAGLDFFFQQCGWRGLLGTIGADLAVEGGRDIQVVSLFVEGVFVFGSGDSVDLVAAPTH